LPGLTTSPNVVAEVAERTEQCKHTLDSALAVPSALKSDNVSKIT